MSNTPWAIIITFIILYHYIHHINMYKDTTTRMTCIINSQILRHWRTIDKFNVPNYNMPEICICQLIHSLKLLHNRISHLKAIRAVTLM